MKSIDAIKYFASNVLRNTDRTPDDVTECLLDMRDRGDTIRVEGDGWYPIYADDHEIRRAVAEVAAEVDESMRRRFGPKPISQG